MDEKSNNSVSAANGLRAAENNASSASLAQSEDSLSGARENELEAGGLYTGSGRDAETNGKGKAKGFFKRKGPIALIIGLILGVGGIMGGAQLFQPFSLIEQFRETFNSMQVSANLRSNTFFRMQMDTGRYKDPIRGKWSIFGGETFKITKRQQNRLAAQGIEYDNNYEGQRVLKYTDNSGNVKIITADAATADKLGNGAVEFRKIYAENADFFNSYNKGSLTWRGAIANWFGTMTAKFLSSNKITRNMFQDFQRKVSESGDGNAKAVTQEIMMKGTEEITEGGMKIIGNEDETDSNGNPTNRKYIVGYDENNQPIYGGTRQQAVENEPVASRTQRSDFQGANASVNIKNKLNDISGNVQKGANVACTVMNTMGAISLLVTASEALQIINLVTAYFETVDKVKAGQGDDAPIHVLTNALNSNTVNTNATLVYKEGVNRVNDESNITEDGIKSIETKYSTTDKTAMQSSGVAALYSGGKVNPNDPSVLSFNPTAIINKIAGGVGVSMLAFEGCAIAKIAANATSAITDALSIAGCIAGVVGAAFTFGMSSSLCSGLAIKAAKGIAYSIAIGVALGAVISTIIPTVSTMLTRDLITNLGGEDLGNALTSGANMYLGNTHRSNGGSLATIDKYKQFAVAQQQVIAENAKYERSQRSPFDMTSKYTFMGNLMTQMMSFMSVNSVMSAVTSTASTLSSSLIALSSSSASAYNIAQELPDSIEEYEKTCPYLASIGAVGDAYCNPYAVTDVSTMGYDPSLDVISYLADENSFLDEPAADGNVKINGDSDLAKYILFCDNRTSAFGIADQNIVNKVSSWGSVETGNSTFNNTINSAIGAVPVIGDAIDVVSNEIALSNLGYVSGASCVAGGESVSPLAHASPSWDKAKYYQRFIEDQSLAETMGVIGEDGNGKSAVAAFLDEYYKEHPLDNSYEGILARYSGLTKDTVVAVLDVIDYYNYIAQYDASTRYAFGSPVVEESHELLFNDASQIANSVYIILSSDIEFADIRNRNFVV